MINTAFASIFAILRQIITWLGTVWSAVGDFQPIFIAIFTGFIVFNLFIRPLLGFTPLASNSQLLAPDSDVSRTAQEFNNRARARKERAAYQVKNDTLYF